MAGVTSVRDVIKADVRVVAVASGKPVPADLDWVDRLSDEQVKGYFRALEGIAALGASRSVEGSGGHLPGGERKLGS